MISRPRVYPVFVAALLLARSRDAMTLVVAHELRQRAIRAF